MSKKPTRKKTRAAKAQPAVKLRSARKKIEKTATRAANAVAKTIAKALAAKSPAGAPTDGTFKVADRVLCDEFCKGDGVGVIAQSDKNLRDAEGQIHFQVQFPNGRECWLSPRYLRRAIDLPPKLPHHPLSKLLPTMSAAERESLKANMAVNGQIDDIVHLDDQILDGRHRQDICHELNIVPRYRAYDLPLAPVDFVNARANHRHMSPDQKAASAVLFMPELEKASLARMNSGKSAADGERAHTRDVAASLFGVPARAIQDARLVYTSDRKLFDEVFNGGLKISVARSQIQRQKKRDVLDKLTQSAAAMPSDGSWEIRCGDVLKEADPKDGSVIVGGYALGFADPPYNIGLDYGRGEKEDSLPESDYHKWCGQWLRAMHKALTPDGSLFVLINHENAAHMEILLRAAGFHVRAWITWYETFGVNCPNNFNRTSRRLFYCVKDKGNFIFHHDAVTRASARQLVYGDKRAATHGKLWDDVWIIPRLAGNAKETLPDGKTQLPVELLKPIVAACSNPGSRVLEFFSGSGSFVEAAISLGRLPLGIDHDKARVKLAIARCSQVKVQKGGGK